MGNVETGHGSENKLLLYLTMNRRSYALRGEILVIVKNLVINRSDSVFEM